jgi:hypothetical protein
MPGAVGDPSAVKSLQDKDKTTNRIRMAVLRYAFMFDLLQARDAPVLISRGAGAGEKKTKKQKKTAQPH